MTRLALRALQRRSQRPFGNEVELLPLLAALLFVAHPIQTQAVTYVVQRLASLATMFYLLSLVLYLKGRLAGAGAANEAAPAGRSPRPWYAGAAAAGVAALATKEIAITLPFALLLCEFCFFEISPARRKRLVLAVGVMLALALAGLLASRYPLGKLLSDVDQTLRLQSELPRSYYFFTQCAVIVTYLRLLLVPVGQNLDYDYPVYTSLLQGRVLGGALLLLLLLGAALYLVGRGADREADQPGHPEGRLVGFGILWMFLTLSVESSLIPIEDVIFEHRMYLPAVGAFVAAAGACGMLARSRPKAVALCTCTWVLLLAGATWQRNLTWGDGITLWQDVVAKSPAKARPYLNLGTELEKKGRYPEAIAAFGKALAIKPDYRQAHGNLGAAYNDVEDFPRAIAILQQGLGKFPGDPDLLNNMGISYAAQGAPEAAIEFFQAAVRVAPQVDKYRLNLATARQESGHP